MEARTLRDDEHLAAHEGTNAHSADNALIRRLVSFERTLEARRSAAGAPPR